MISTQNRGNKTRNCASDVQNRKDTKPAWVWLFPRNLIAFSSITKERAEIPLQRETKSKQNKNKFSVNVNYSCFERGCQKKCKSADDNPKRYSFCGRFSGHGSLTTGFQGNLRNIIARSLFSTNFIKNFYKWYLLYLRATIQGVKLVWILLSFYSISSFLTNTMCKHLKWIIISLYQSCCRPLKV